jgi:4-hydroxy-tetrahydrodipicolinate reductase
MKTHIAIHGVTGRMGQRLVALAREDHDLAVTAAVASSQSKSLGRDAGELAGVGALGVPVRDDLPLDARVDVVIDFSTPEGTMALLPACVARKIPVVVATTGFTPEQRQRVEEAAHDTAVLIAANTSLAVNVLYKLAAEAGRLLAGRGFDVEIVERHHRFKKDSPSGTALAIARVLQQAMGQTELRHGREGNVGERRPQEIGLHAVRVGDNVGEHTVIFSTLGETIELVQKGHSRDCYARGALAAAKFLAARPAGRYSMNDVLGL